MEKKNNTMDIFDANLTRELEIDTKTKSYDWYLLFSNFSSNQRHKDQLKSIIRYKIAKVDKLVIK